MSASVKSNKKYIPKERKEFAAILEGKKPIIESNTNFIFGNTIEFSANLEDNEGKDICTYNTVTCKNIPLELKHCRDHYEIRGKWLNQIYYKKRNIFNGREVKADITIFAHTGSLDQEAETRLGSDNSVKIVNSPQWIRTNPSREQRIKSEKFIFSISMALAYEHFSDLCRLLLQTRRKDFLRLYKDSLKRMDVLQASFKLYLKYMMRKTIDDIDFERVERICKFTDIPNTYIDELREKLEYTKTHAKKIDLVSEPYVLHDSRLVSISDHSFNTSYLSVPIDSLKPPDNRFFSSKFMLPLVDTILIILIALLDLLSRRYIT